MARLPGAGAEAAFRRRLRAAGCAVLLGFHRFLAKALKEGTPPRSAMSLWTTRCSPALPSDEALHTPLVGRALEVPCTTCARGAQREGGRRAAREDPRSDQSLGPRSASARRQIKAERSSPRSARRWRKQAGAEQGRARRRRPRRSEARAAKQEHGEYDAAMRRSVRLQLPRKRVCEGARGAVDRRACWRRAAGGRRWRVAAGTGAWREGEDGRDARDAVSFSPPQQPPQPVMPVELNHGARPAHAQPAHVVEKPGRVAWSHRRDASNHAQGLDNHRRPRSVCRASGAAGITLGDLKHQLDKELRVTEHVDAH